MPLDIANAFDRVWHAGVLHKLKSYGISGQIFGRISSFLSNRRLLVVLDGKSPQEYPVNAALAQGSILAPTIFLLYINDLSGNVISVLLSILMILFSILSVFRHRICGNNLNWLLNLNQDPRNAVDWGKTWLADFNAGKTQLVSFDRSNNNGSIDVKMEKSSRGKIIF